MSPIQNPKPVKTALSEVYPMEAEKAREILEPFRRGMDGIVLTMQGADRLEQAICEALVNAKGTPDADTGC